MVTLYWMDISHPSQAVRKMLELKGIEFKLVNVLPMNQRVHLRLAGFRGGTVPAIKLSDGRRVQGSRQIAKALDQLVPEPPLFPADPELRARVEQAERWGDEELQPVPRRIARYGAVSNLELRRWALAEQKIPGAEVIVRASGPLIHYYGRTVEVDGRRANESGVKADLAALPKLLEHVDGLLADGTVTVDPPNAATLQILSSVRILMALDDLREFVSGYRCAEPALELFNRYPGRLPSFLRPEWLPSRPTRGPLAPPAQAGCPQSPDEAPRPRSRGRDPRSPRCSGEL
jgi:glutathione S-transferase